MAKSNCDMCNNMIYDEEYADYVCTVNLDEDEIERFYRDEHYVCPYYQSNNEYSIVKKQM